MHGSLLVASPPQLRSAAGCFGGSEHSGCLEPIDLVSTNERFGRARDAHRRRAPRRGGITVTDDDRQSLEVTHIVERRSNRSEQQPSQRIRSTDVLDCHRRRVIKLDDHGATTEESSDCPLAHMNLDDPRKPDLIALAPKDTFDEQHPLCGDGDNSRMPAQPSCSSPYPEQHKESKRCVDGERTLHPLQSIDAEHAKGSDDSTRHNRTTQRSGRGSNLDHHLFAVDQISLPYAHDCRVPAEQLTPSDPRRCE